jgi:rhodanese-related sulfurtransferase
MNTSKKDFLLDVRTTQEFKEQSVPNSTNTPLNKIPNNLEKLKQINQTILLICRSGARASAAQDFLNNQGIKNTKVLEGGLLSNPHLLK